jgi:hypothetical protein
MNDRESQKKIYTSFYGYAMAVCDRYTNNQDDAVEILNDGLKIFKEIHRYKPVYSDAVSPLKAGYEKSWWQSPLIIFEKSEVPVYDRPGQRSYPDLPEEKTRLTGFHKMRSLGQL